MPLFSTIAHDGPFTARAPWPKRIWMIAAGLALAAAVGLVIANGTGTEQSVTTATSASSLSHDEFIRLNTTALDGLVPAAQAAVQSPAVVDPFVHMNTTALDGLAPAASATRSLDVADPFIHINTIALEYPAVRYSERSTGPR